MTTASPSPANLADLAALWSPACAPPLVLDVRDPHEVAAGKGGPPGSITGAVNVPLNVAGAKQSDHRTTQAEFVAKLAAVSGKRASLAAAPAASHPRASAGTVQVVFRRC